MSEYIVRRSLRWRLRRAPSHFRAIYTISRHRLGIAQRLMYAAWMTLILIFDNTPRRFTRDD